MLSPSPALRAAFIGLVVATVAVLGVTGLHLRTLEEQAEAHAWSDLQGRAATLAAALVSQGDASERLAAFEAAIRADWPVDFALISSRGQVAAASDQGVARDIGWGLMIDSGESAQEVYRGRTGYYVAIHPVGRTGQYVASITPSSTVELSSERVWSSAVWAAALWGVMIGCLAIMAWYTGHYTSSRLERLAVRISAGDADPDVLMRHARLSLGEMATVFAPIAHKMTRAWASVAQSREHVRALYQVNPHYVLLCSLDGRIIEANPAFYAVTGLSLEALKAGPVEVLDDIFPIGPLDEMARRSLKEACSIGGIEYGIIGQDDEPRAVQVSLRAFELDGEDVVIIQATDVSARRTMEQRIHAFNDTLDLMVDQRVAQLTAGQRSIRRVLDAAGLVLASFDSGGATRRWSGGARALTGRTVGHVPHFSSVTSSLEMSEADRSAFTAWFWSNDAQPFVGRHAIPLDGVARVRRFVWRKSQALDRGDLRTIVGLELPPDPSEAPARPAAAPEPAPRAVPEPLPDVRRATDLEGAAAPPAGDGHPGLAPLPDTAFGRQPED